MFVLKAVANKPIKIWLEDPSQVEVSCMEQAVNLANLPCTFHHVVLLPDCHTGYGMPIGGVLAAEDAIIPNAVGNDIGCGVSFVHVDLPADLLNEVKVDNGTLAQKIVGDIMRSIPTGFAHQKTPQPSSTLDKFEPPALLMPQLEKELERAYFQLGTLGSGNHFIELQADDDGKLGLMVHSGSRNLGLQICRAFNKRAQALNAKLSAPVPPEWQLAYLPTDTPEGRAYIAWMNMALAFAKENRALMMRRVKEVVFENLSKHAGVDDTRIDLEVDAHHNYAALENHFGKDVWVHRKGAIRAGRDEYGIIPGAMGSFSYIVKGKGNPESFFSCSHGAGRVMSRNEAVKQFSVQEVIEDLKSQNVVLGKRKRSDVAEESRWAYKDINEVLNYQRDLVDPVLRLRTVAVVKG
ncbi:MAG: RtcB family protein [Firmicutes bacterium]|jgi:tRNA-splicing ligase RtcB|nr:RtcB family protein [Bacillota bacterium]